MSAYAHAYELLASATTGRTRRGRDGAVLAISGTPVASLNAIISAGLEPSPDEIALLAESENWDVPWSIHVRGVPAPPVTAVATRYGLTQLGEHVYESAGFRTEEHLTVITAPS